LSALVFATRGLPPQRIDVSSLVPALLRGRNRDEIRAMRLAVGNRAVAVGELFDVRGTDPDRLVFDGAGDRLDRIGAGLEGGAIEVRGPAGAYVGIGMRAGRIEVQGACGPFCASGMRDGLIAIRGSAGDFVGAPLPGEMQGMRGGTVLVAGDAGARVGDRMRRGAILVAGSVGDYCGARMIAGTVAVCGPCGEWPGYAMRRGTLVLRGGARAVPPTFDDCGTHALPMMPLLVRSWRRLDPAFAVFEELSVRARRLMGDAACGGMGEILLPA
jgi:formylmethanofuran dehydrogenase subunit C